MSVRVATTGRPGEFWLVLEHATQALSSLSERKFSRYLVHHQTAKGVCQ